MKKSFGESMLEAMLSIVVRDFKDCELVIDEIDELNRLDEIDKSAKLDLVCLLEKKIKCFQGYVEKLKL